MIINNDHNNVFWRILLFYQCKILLCVFFSFVIFPIAKLKIHNWLWGFFFFVCFFSLNGETRKTSLSEESYRRARVTEQQNRNSDCEVTQSCTQNGFLDCKRTPDIRNPYSER